MKIFYSIKIISLLIIYTVFAPELLFAVEPTTQASNMAATAATGTSISLSWTRGNGASVLVLGRVTSVNAGPADLNTYSASTTFGSGSAIVGFPSDPANYVVYIGTGTTVTVSGLSAGTTYEFYAFEFNGSGGTEDYLTSGSTNNISQITGPSSQANSITFSSVTTTSMTVNWTSGDGSNRIVAVKEGTQGTITNPSFGTKYATSSDWSVKGDQLGTSGYYIVYDGNGTTVSLTNLSVSTTYWVQIFDYNEPDTAYITSTATNNPLSQTTLKNAPTSQATNVTFSSVATTSMTVSWTRGDGDYCLVIAEASGDANAPSDGTDYTANAAFGSGDAIAATGTSYVVYEGTGTTVDITSLTAGTTYYYKVYEFNNTGTNTKYLVTDGTNNPNSQATVSAAPTTQSSSITFSSVSTTSMTINWTSGDGTSRIVAVRETDQGTITNPSDNTTYSASSDWSVKGGQLGTSGYYIVYNGSSNTVSLTNLAANTTYWVQIFDYNNGAGSETYLTTTATGNPNSQLTLKNAPTTQASQVTFSTIQATTMTTGWTRGDGDSVLVLAKSGSTVDASPSDGTTYTANAAFGSGDQIGTGNYVIYNGSSTSVDITALTASTTYYIKAFEYNNTGTDTKYIITDGTNNPNSQITLEAEPTTQASSIVFSSVQETQMTLTWTNGDGNNRIVLAHSGSAVDSDPVDATTYTANSIFSSGDQIGTGNYVIYSGSSNTVTVTGLTGATTYYFKVYEFNSGTGGTNYYTAGFGGTNPNSQSTTTAAAPSTQASSISFTSVTTTSLTINWTNGDGTSRIVAVRETDQGTITNPSDNTTYAASSDWASKGDQLGTSGYYIVYNGSSNSVALSNLSADTDYWVQIFEYNNAPGAEAYNTSTATGNPNNQITLKLEPTNEVTGFTSGTVTNNSMQLNWTDASAGVLPDGYLIKASTTNLGAISDPVDGTAEADDTDLSDGSGAKNVIQGDQTYTFSSLNFSTAYYFKIYSYTNSGTDINYKNTTTQTVADSTLPDDPGSFAATSASSSQIDLTFTTNGSDNVIIVWDADGTFTTPSGTPPAVGNPFAGGTVLYNGTTSPVNHTSLTANTQYFYKAWSVNSNDEYSANGLTDNATTFKSEPSEHVTNFDTVSVTYNSIDLDWTASGGSVLPDGYLIVAQTGAGTYATVADGTPVSDDSDWTDNNAAQNITYGTNTVTFSGLSMDVSYDFKIYPYTNSGSGIDFKTSVTVPEKTGVITNPGGAIWSALTPDDPAGVHEVDLGWSQNSNSDSVIIARNTSNSFAVPVNDTKYTVGGSMGGTETVVYKDNAATTYADNDGGTGLAASQIYFYRIWSLNNNKYSTGSTSNTTTYKDAPTTQASEIVFSNITSTSLTISWTSGNGDSSIVAVRETDQGTITNPSDNTVYTASSDWASKGSQLGTSGYYIVYNGASNSVTITNLTSNTAYWVQIFEYNNSSTYSLYYTGTGT
ncbi:MAG: NDNF family protein, partial [Chlorobi bacterium]|nr:NDNF family protein [Chlorobiota bacterium]